MSKQTDLINIPDAITVSGSNVGINEQSPDRQLHITDASEVNIKLEAGAETSEIRLKDSDNALSLHLNNNERMELKSDEVNWTNSTNGFYNKIYGPSSGDISSGFMTYRGSTLRGGLYTNPSHGLTVISEVDISFRANNANRMHIDTSGRVTKPNQPAFHYRLASGSAITTSNGVASVTFSVSLGATSGNGYNASTGIFTAPVAGWYAFNLTFYFAGGGNYIGTKLLQSNGDSYYSFDNTGADVHTPLSKILYLNAGDWLRPQIYTYQATTLHVMHSYFSGYLLG